MKEQKKFTIALRGSGQVVRDAVKPVSEKERIFLNSFPDSQNDFAGFIFDSDKNTYPLRFQRSTTDDGKVFIRGKLENGIPSKLGIEFSLFGTEIFQESSGQYCYGFTVHYDENPEPEISAEVKELMQRMFAKKPTEKRRKGGGKK